MTKIPMPADNADDFDLTYDAWNRLVKVEDGEDTVAEYEYTGDNRRVVKDTYSAGTLGVLPASVKNISRGAGAGARDGGWGWGSSTQLLQRDQAADGALDLVAGRMSVPRIMLLAATVDSSTASSRPVTGPPPRRDAPGP